MSKRHSCDGCGIMIHDWNKGNEVIVHIINARETIIVNRSFDFCFKCIGVYEKAVQPANIFVDINSKKS
jgi:hypothetical protein